MLWDCNMGKWSYDMPNIVLGFGTLGTRWKYE